MEISWLNKPLLEQTDGTFPSPYNKARKLSSFLQTLRSQANELLICFSFLTDRNFIGYLPGVYTLCFKGDATALLENSTVPAWDSLTDLGSSDKWVRRHDNFLKVSLKINDYTSGSLCLKYMSWKENHDENIFTVRFQCKTNRVPPHFGGQ